MRFDLEQFIFALSDTVDLVGIDEIMHSKRVSYMAWNCASAIDTDPTQRRRLLHLGLLHDCGISSSEERNHIVGELEWPDSHIHCRIGAQRLSYLLPLKDQAPAILHHHTRWETLRDLDLPETDKTEANLLYLVDRIDYLGQVIPGSGWLSKKDIIRHKISGFKSCYFKSELVEAFLDTSANEAFWFGLEVENLQDFIHEQKNQHTDISISIDELHTVANLFAQIVDAKSQFTAEHSKGVANLARHLAELCGLDHERQVLVEIAGLLHDLGKLRVPDHVLESAKPLNAEELSHMRHHSYATYQILSKIEGLERIAEWASNHHEALDGSGYPFRKKADKLSLESRIIAIADIFQALAQRRPYRDAEPLEKIVAFLESHSARGRLDADLVSIMSSNSESCYQAATNTRRN